MPYDNHSPNDDVIDNFPERMERFLNCITQVYFQQESFDAIISGNNKTHGKGLLRNYEMEMMKKKAQDGTRKVAVKTEIADRTALSHLVVKWLTLMIDSLELWTHCQQCVLHNVNNLRKHFRELYCIVFK